MAPRAVAPERNIDLRAMRQLANMSAKTAINKHESTQLTGTTRSKLVITIVAGLIGVALLGLRFLAKSPVITLTAALASFVVAGYWGVSYVLLYKRMLDIRKAHMERHLKAGEEAPAAHPAKAPAAEAADKALEETVDVSQ
jgi:hypothetical protein